MRKPPSVACAAIAESSFQIIDPLQPEDALYWDEMAVSDANATVFHTSAWARVLAETYRYRPVYMIFRGKNEAKMLLPMMEVRSAITGTRGVSLPFTDFCDSLTLGEWDITDLPEQIKEYARSRGWKSIEFRGVQGDNATPSASYYGHVLSLTSDTDELFAGLTGSTRRNVRKAIREDVEITISSSEEAVKKYYQLHCVTRKRHGKPPQPYSFFRNIHRHVIGKDMGFVVLASKAGVTVAGAVYLSLGKRAIYKFGASDYAHQHLRANSLVMWEAIKKLADSGAQYLYFGRTDLSHDGLRRFKMGFGAEERLDNYFKLDMRTSTFVEESPLMLQLAQRLEPSFRAMPIPLLRMAGAVLYRHIG